MTSRLKSEGLVVRTLRQFLGLKQIELAELVGASQTQISLIEKGRRPIPEPLRPALAEVLRVETSVFDAGSDFAETLACNFRSLRSAPAVARDQAAAHVQLLRALIRQLERFVRLPEVDLPDVRGKAPDEAAAMARDYWGLGQDNPIASMVRVLENAGAIVAQFDSLSDKLDAFSASSGGRPVVVLSNARAKESATRRRMSLAHELGHVLLHQHQSAELGEREAEADAFASAFLLPKEAFFRVYPRGERNYPWNSLFDMKKRWGTSVAAIVYRAHTLDLISYAAYRRAFRQLRRRWYPVEPFEPTPEEPELLPGAIQLIASSRNAIRAQQLAVDLGWSVEILSRVTGSVLDDNRTAERPRSVG